MRRLLPMITLLALTTAGTPRPARAEEPVRPVTDRPFERLGRALRPEWSRKTLGGIWFWSDVFHNGGWRIQKHVLTGHHRLIDPANARHRSGTYEQCLETFEREVAAEERNRPLERVAIVVHGLGNWSSCLREHARELREQGYTVVPFDYPSNFAPVEEHAANLARVIRSLPPTQRIDFVGHSLGGIVVRALLAKVSDARFGRLVLVGTPNNGAELAQALRNSLLFDLALGPSGRQLVGGEGTFLASLGPPPIEFACIAGGRRKLGYNPFLKGNDDGLVTVESVRLPGASDFALVDASHHWLLHDDETIEMTARFLRTGRLRAWGRPTPIPVEDGTFSPIEPE